IRRLLCIQPLRDQIFRIGPHVLSEEEAGEGKTIIQRDESLADQRCDLEQHIMLDLETCRRKIRLDTRGQVLGREETNMSSVKVIQLLEIDRGRRWSQCINIKSLDHLLKSHYFIFSHPPAHQYDPIQHTFRDIA